MDVLSLPPPGALCAGGLYLVRTSALIVASPIYGSGTGFTGHRIALIVALSLLLYSATGVPMADPVGPLEFGAFAVREILIGLALAFVLHLVILAVRVAGEMIGQEMGMSMSAVMDPATGISTPMVAQIYEGFFILGLLAIDGHHWLLRALAHSFEKAPVGHIGGSAGLWPAIEHLFTDMFVTGLTFAAPVLVLLFIVSLLTALLSRALPQLNLMEAGYALRILAALAAMYLFAPMLAPAMDGLYVALQRGLDDVLAAI